MAEEKIKLTLTIEYHGEEYELPWEIIKESIEPKVMGSKNDMFERREEVFSEAVRFLQSSLKLDQEKEGPYVCEQCGLEVEKIPTWKDGECPEDDHQHRFRSKGSD